jgi:hypothetical protein
VGEVLVEVDGRRVVDVLTVNAWHYTFTGDGHLDRERWH